MSRTVCSWCKAPLVLKDDILVCSNTDCPACDEKFLHEELIRTRKALDDAKKWLMKIGYLNMSDHGLGSETMMTDWCKTVALHALKEIETALEQKDAK